MRWNQILGLPLAAFGLAAATGCRQAAEPVAASPEPTVSVAEAAPISATYVCDSGLTVAVAYPDPQSAQVTYRDRTYALRGAPAASGARYSDAEVEWRSLTRDGVESATLSRLVAEDAPVVVERCRRPAPVAPRIVAPIASEPGAAPPPLAASTAPAGLLPCRGPQLKLSAEGGDAGASNRISVLGVQNLGAQACSLMGYPTVVLQDRQNRDLTDIGAVQTLGSHFRGGQTPTPVRLEPRGKAYFDIAWNVASDESLGQRACPSVARIRVIAPGDTSPVTLDKAFSPCGGAVRVSPIRLVRQPVREPAPAAAAKF